MSSTQSNDLDVFEMERMVAAALVELVDDPHQQHRITPKLLASRTGLTVRRVREVTNEWNLQTLSDDEYWLSPALVEQVREVLRAPQKE